MFEFILFCLIMKILVVAAMPGELKTIKEWIKSANLKDNLDIDYLCCGVWNYEAISSLEHYLTKNKEPTFIWNIWICGYWNQYEERKSETIQVASVINLYTFKEAVIPPFLQIAPLKNCFCSESVIYEKPEFNSKNFAINNEFYFDMESRWIEFVASRYKYPRLILKVPFDFIGNERIKKWNYGELCSGLAWILKNLPFHDFLKSILECINRQ